LKSGDKFYVRILLNKIS